MYEHASFLLRSPLSLKILEVLNSSGQPLAPLQISKKSDIARSNVSTKLIELKKRRYVDCVNPEDRKWRFYKITTLGQKVLKEVEKLK